MSQLKQRLQPYVEGQTESFLQTMAEEAESLNQSAFGGPMLKTIGQGGSMHLQAVHLANFNCLAQSLTGRRCTYLGF